MTREVEQVLQERARSLARPTGEESERGQARKVLRWERGEHGFGVPLAATRAVIPISRLAAVPRATPPLAGITGFRGGLVPAYEPGPLLAADVLPSTAATWALVLDGEPPLALLADRLPRLEAIEPSDLGPAGGDLPAEARRCIDGVHRTGWVLLDVGAVGSDPRLTFSSPPIPPRPEDVAS